MEKILLCTFNKDSINSFNIGLEDYIVVDAVFSEFNYLEIISKEKPTAIIIIDNSINNFVLLSRILSENISLILISRVNNYRCFDNIYNYHYVSDLDFSKSFLDNIIKSDKHINELNIKINDLKNDIEEIKLCQKAKRKLINKGMSEEDAHKYITKYSMNDRITKMETAKKILND